MLSVTVDTEDDNGYDSEERDGYEWVVNTEGISRCCVRDSRHHGCLWISIDSLTLRLRSEGFEIEFAQNLIGFGSEFSAYAQQVQIQLRTTLQQCCKSQEKRN